MELTMLQLRRMAAHLGHTNLQARESRRGWSGTCACGFVSGRVPTQVLAEQALADHFSRAADTFMRKARASGRDTAAIVADLEARRAI
jgi:hypothetical protein